jgi:hypothetical protein
MCRHHWLVLVLHGWCLGGCFRELGSGQHESEPLPALTLDVRDQNDAFWDIENTPRVPVFFLQAADGSALDVTRHLFLLRGVPSEDVLDDLRSTTLRAATELARVALDTDACAGLPNQACAAPRGPLDAGARYTLVWATVAGSVQFPIIVSTSPAAGARAVESLPGELSGQVPINLARAIVRFDGYLAPHSPPLALADEAGRDIPAESRLRPCAELGLPEGDCAELTPSTVLARATRHTLRFTGALFDLTGARIPEREISFVTAADSDTRAPGLRARDCMKDERLIASLCVLAGEAEVSIRARSDESGLLTLTTGTREAAAIGASTDFALTLPLEAATALSLTLGDLAGNNSYAQLTLAPAADLPRVAIDEVRVDPLGPEPTQEYVELLNFGASTISIMGFSLTHDPFAQGQPIPGELTLAPGERVLVVAPEFDAQESSDGALPAGVRLARLARPLSLRNEGSALYLRDALGRRLSAAPALVPEKPGQCIYRIASDGRSGEAVAFARDVHAGCTPGAASAP